MTDEGITQQIWAHKKPIKVIEIRFNVVMRPRRVVGILPLEHEVHHSAVAKAWRQDLLFESGLP
jgi:hypothetical protein